MDAELEQAIKQARYQFKVRYGNRRCPYPGCTHKATDAHHVLVTRHPDHPALYVPENMVLVCNTCHVPPRLDLNYWCIYWMLTKGRRTPEQIEAWARGLGKVFDEPPALPAIYYTVRAKVRRERERKV